jgi:hypothetical protein
MATFALAGCGGDRATLATFAAGWHGHGRTLKMTRSGNAEEWISHGLGNFVVALRFHLSRPRGTPHDVTATATVTAVRIGDRSAFTAARPPPRVGESRRIRLRNGVITRDADWSELLRSHRRGFVRRGLWRIGRREEAPANSRATTRDSLAA